MTSRPIADGDYRPAVSAPLEKRGGWGAAWRRFRLLAKLRARRLRGGMTSVTDASRGLATRNTTRARGLLAAPTPPRLSSARTVTATIHGGVVLRLVLSRAARITISVQLLRAGARASQREHRPRLLGGAHQRSRSGAGTIRIRRIRGKRLVKVLSRLSIARAGAPNSTTVRALPHDPTLTPAWLMI